MNRNHRELFGTLYDKEKQTWTCLQRIVNDMSDTIALRDSIGINLVSVGKCLETPDPPGHYPVERCDKVAALETTLTDNK